MDIRRNLPTETVVKDGLAQGGGGVTVSRDAQETSGTTQCHGLCVKAVLGPQLELGYLSGLFQPNGSRDCELSAGRAGRAERVSPHPLTVPAWPVPSLPLRAPPVLLLLLPRGVFSPPRGAAPAFLLLLLLPPRSCGAGWAERGRRSLPPV